MSSQQRNDQRGVVSLFIVIFTALLITVVTISFVQLMLHDQQQASTSDLSQSAYDSAQAGVEDAKRALLLEQNCDQNGQVVAGVDCAKVRAALASNSCDSVSTALNMPQPNNETLIQQDEADKNLDQAYTCVKVSVNTPDYVGTLQTNDSQVIPLSGTSSFDRIEINWFTSSDSPSRTMSYPAIISLPKSNGSVWKGNTPALMRSQLIQVGGRFTQSNLDTASGANSDVNTLFLYPSSIGSNTKNFADDDRRSGLAAPQIIRCQPNFVTATYACSATITLPSPIDGSANNRTAFLRLSAIYNKSTFQIKLKNGATDVPFSGAQSEVDSTGRANDLFRRVKSRVTLGGGFPYPQAAVDITGNLCKNFSITDDPADYVSSCTP
ncbi:MAG: hypothetical protein ABIQ04_05120 [Candidatus Saccharimonadales bacterium]